MPQGSLEEVGPIAGAYWLTETPSASYLYCTEWNVRGSDATLVLTLTDKLDGGAKRTELLSDALDKPWLHMWENVHPEIYRPVSCAARR